jgi:hypothetical protein
MSSATVQPESEIQKDTAAVLAERMTALFEEVRATLTRERTEAWNTFAEAKRGEIESLMRESSDLDAKASELESTLAAVARVAQYESDVLLLQGKAEESAARLGEAETARNAPAAMRARQAEIDTRIDRLQDEMRAEGRRIFEDFYPKCQTVVRAAERGLFQMLLGGFSESFSAFAHLTGNGPRPDPRGSGAVTQGMVRQFHFDNLTADEKDSLWVMGNRLYGGREKVA